MIASSFALSCVSNGSHCVAEGHQGQIGPDGMCRVNRAFKKSLKICACCGERPVLPTARALNPILIVGHRRGLAVRPTIISSHMAAFVKVLATFGQPICEACIAQVEPFINAKTDFPGKIAFTTGTKVPMFIDDNVLKLTWEAISVGPVKVAEAIMAGRKVVFGHQRGTGDDATAQCVVHRNMESDCLCGGWYLKSLMPTLSPRPNQSFGFGPMCAEAVRRAGFKLGETLGERMADIHTKAFLARLEADTIERNRIAKLAKGGVFVDSRGVEHVGEVAIERALADKRERDLRKAHDLKSEGRHVPQALQALLDEESGAQTYEPPVRRSKPRSTTSKEPMSGEERLRALAESVAKKKAERAARQAEIEARRADPHYGECTKAPAKQGKKKPAAEADEKPGHRGGKQKQKAA